SSTVAPLSEAAAELFQEENSGVRVTVGTSGTGGGFEKFCNGETDISDASRAIEADEAAACQAKGIAYQELVVGLDGLSVVVSKDNDWAKCLTIPQLNKIWGADSVIQNWKDVDASFPDVALTLFGPGTDSGTFDYFTAAVNGKEGVSRTDYNATEDDNVTVNGVTGTKGGLGYLGLSYVQQNQGKVKGVSVDGGAGCIAPTTATVQNGSYKPLGRPLYIYVKADALDRPAVTEFVNFYISNGSEIAKQALFVPMTAEQQQAAQTKIDALKGS
ncbi:MAG: PstS family phosphate ABC transporter substrate-binding protein, partial [Pseudonocardiaceae bacterium]